LRLSKRETEGNPPQLAEGTLPKWKITLNEEKRRLTKLAEEKIPEIEAAWDNEMVSIGRESFPIIESSPDEKNQSNLQRLMKEYNDLMAAISEVNDRETRIRMRPLLYLHGIVGIVQGFALHHKYSYRGFVIPSENFLSVRFGISSGVFSKELEKGDISLLRFISGRTSEIRRGKNLGHNPRFSVVQIMRETGISQRELVCESLYRLTGLLCHAYGPVSRPYNVRNKPVSFYDDSWYIPTARKNLILEVLS
jgi:hypothetical protein